jgi:hypothetical protein
MMQMQGWQLPEVELLFSLFSRERGERHDIGVLEVVAMIFGNFLLHLPSRSNEYLPTKGAFEGV